MDLGECESGLAARSSTPLPPLRLRQLETPVYNLTRPMHDHPLGSIIDHPHGRFPSFTIVHDGPNYVHMYRIVANVWPFYTSCILAIGT